MIDIVKNAIRDALLSVYMDKPAKGFSDRIYKDVRINLLSESYETPGGERRNVNQFNVEFLTVTSDGTFQEWVEVF